LGSLFGLVAEFRFRRLDFIEVHSIQDKFSREASNWHPMLFRERWRYLLICNNAA